MRHISIEPPAFFHRGPAPITRLAFFGLISIALLFVDTRYHYLEGIRRAVAIALYPLQRTAQLPGEVLGGIGTYFASLQSLTDELLSCDRVASMKFHGCVVAITHGVPCLALSAANKFKNFYAELGKQDWVSSLADEHLETKLEAFLDAPRMAFPPSIRAHAVEGLAVLREDLGQAAASGGAPRRASAGGR